MLGAQIGLMIDFMLANGTADLSTPSLISANIDDRKNCLNGFEILSEIRRRESSF